MFLDLHITLGGVLRDFMFNMEIDEVSIMYGILVFLWLDYLWELYLAVRQYKKCQKTIDVPVELKGIMTKETFDKARLYSLDKQRFSFIHDFYNIFMSTVVIYYGFLAYVWNVAESVNNWEGEVAVSCIWLFILTTMSTFVNMPLTIYYTFVLEEKYGFNKQTVKFFIIDKIKAFIVNQVLSLPISAVAIIIVKYGGDLFFVWLWFTVGLIVLFLMAIYPSYIAPIFDTFTPLPDGDLRKKIEELAAQLKFPLGQLYVVEGSKRSAHSNAYFVGLFKTKRIVLYDTLLENPQTGGCQDDEVVAVLSHELGHWKHSHNHKNLAMMQVNLFFMFAVFAKMFRLSLLYRAVGFHNVQPVLVGLLVVMQYVMMPYNNVVSFLMTCLSRKFEYQADDFAVKLGKGSLLKSALVKLNKDNLGFPIYDHWYSAWHHSHPPLLERLATIDQKCK